MQPSFNFSPSLPPSLPVLLSPIPKGAQYDPMKYNNPAAIAIKNLAKKMPLVWKTVDDGYMYHICEVCPACITKLFIM